MTAAMAPTEKTGSGLPALLRLSGPVVASRLGIMAMGLVDTIVVGRYSAAELGYHALAWAVTGVGRMSTPRIAVMATTRSAVARSTAAAILRATRCSARTGMVPAGEGAGDSVFRRTVNAVR